jgi:hypothetical protein
MCTAKGSWDGSRNKDSMDAGTKICQGQDNLDMEARDSNHENWTSSQETEFIKGDSLGLDAHGRADGSLGRMPNDLRTELKCGRPPD